jgi:putative membrane protein
MTPFPLFFRALLRFAGLAILVAPALTGAWANVTRGPFVNTAAAVRPVGELAPVAADGLRPVDRTFFDRAVGLSQQQMALAKLAVSHALRADVRTFAQQLAGDYRQIVDSVQNLRRRRGAATEEAVGPAPVSEAYGKLSQVTGAEFDREFIITIETLRAETMTLFEEVISQTKDAEVRDLIGGYLPMLRDHQNQGTELKRELE